MKAVVIGAAGHIGTYLIPMLVDNGYDTVAITRSMSAPYEDAPAWHRVKRVLADRENCWLISRLIKMHLRRIRSDRLLLEAVIQWRDFRVHGRCLIAPI